jgi:hypothetical protein
MGRITLSQNHKRSVSSALYVLEEIVDDLEQVISRSEESITVGWIRNIPDDQIQKTLVAIQEVRYEIKHLMEKY